MLDAELLCATCGGHLGWLLAHPLHPPEVSCDSCHQRAVEQAGQARIDYEKSVREKQGMGLPFIYRDPLLRSTADEGDSQNVRISIGACARRREVRGIALWLPLAVRGPARRADVEPSTELAIARPVHACRRMGRQKAHSPDRLAECAPMNHEQFHQGEIAIVVDGVDSSMLGSEAEVLQPLTPMLTFNYLTGGVICVMAVYEIRLLTNGMVGPVVPGDLRKRRDRQDWSRLCALSNEGKPRESVQ